MALECRSSTFSLETKIYAEPDGISDDLTRIGSVTLQELKRKIKALCNGETPIKLKSSNTPIPVICTYESLEPLGLFGSLLWKEVTASAGSDIGTFRIIPISYLEAMCSVSDEEIFLQALNALEVNADWTNPNGEHGEPEWRKAMPNPMPSNPILENVAENFLSFLPDDSVDK